MKSCKMQYLGRITHYIFPCIASHHSRTMNFCSGMPLSLMFLRISCFVLLGILPMISVRAQQVDFPDDKTAFYPVYKKFLEDADKKEFKPVLDQFEVIWNEGPFDVYKPQFIAFTKEMQKKKLRPLPHYKNFLTAMMNFYRSGKQKQDFDGWIQGLEWLIKKKSASTFDGYVVLCAELFRDNYIYISQGHSWKSESNAYRFEPVTDNITITFTNINLTCSGRNDKTLIEGTSGTLYPIDDRFVGQGGRLYWDRAGMPKNQVYADMGTYTIPINRATFTADSVNFTHNGYFSEPLLGRVEEKLTDVGETRVSSYPKFTSYTKRFRITDISKDVDYEGGFSFHGNQFYASGDTSQLASLIFKYKGQPLLRASSRSFGIEEKRYNSNMASVVIYLGEDSIYHPGLQLKYRVDTMELTLLRLDQGITQTPFLNSYHKVEMYFEALYWRLGTDFMRVSMVKNSAESFANFRSMSFYSELEYERIQGLDEIHPMIRMNHHFKGQNNKKDFSAQEIARLFKIDISEARQMLIRLNIEGIVNYDVERETGTITEKFTSYINAATRMGDYDRIEFVSSYSGDNGKLSLLDYRFDLKGVERVLLSDSQRVVVYPIGQQLVLKKNRDFEFGGTIFAGRFKIFGKKCEFLYNDFKIKMEDVDSVVFAVPSFRLNTLGERPLRKVETSIQDLSGELLIDGPANKSGYKPMSTYPTLVSNKKSYTYYDARFIEGGVYKRDNFYFELEPFRVDSLDNFVNTQIRFDGQLFSADIFPVIKEKLKVMPDYSLGFEKNTGAAGLPAYGGKGTFYDTVNLSNQGLRGFGKLTYLNTVTNSRKMIFYPDSMNALAEKFAMKKQKSGPESPDVEGEQVRIHWEPYLDKYGVKTTDKPLAMYGKESKLKGDLVVSNSGLTGGGSLEVGNAEFVSKGYTFKYDKFNADTTSFALKDIYEKGADGSELAFFADNLSANVSFADRKGKFNFNDPSAFVNFPQNKYKANIQELIWKMGSGGDTTASSELDMKGAKFIATDKNVDTLNFRAPKASFQLKDKVISSSEVEHVDVADSRIFPKDKKVIIRKEGLIDPFEKAKIWVGKESQIHMLDSADVTILSLHQYRGAAQYAYVDEIGVSQIIRFDSIWVEKGDITHAEGRLEQTNDFSLSPNFGFRGKVNLVGNNQLLTFTGFVKINHNCPLVTNDYVRFSAEINPKQIMIPVPAEPLNEKNNKLFNGFLFASDTSGLYTAIFTGKKKFSDYEVLKASGYLYFDKNSQEFVVARKEKIFDKSLPGNYLAFNTKDCKSYGEGRIDLGAKFGQVNVSSAGRVTYAPEQDSTEMSLLMTVDLKLDNQVWKFLKENFGTGSASFSDETTQRYASDLLDSARAEKLYADIGTDGKFKRLPKELSKAFVLGGVDFKWDKSLRSFIHKGTVDLFVMDGQQIMQNVDAVIELNRKGGGDALTMYFEINDDFFFFSYRNNVLQVYSSRKEFNDLVNSIDAAKKQFTADGQPTYSFSISSQRRVDRFKEQLGVQ